MIVGLPQNGLASRFSMLRENAGISREQVAVAMGISVASVWDIESSDNELFDVYSPADVQQLCLILGVSTDQLFGTETKGTRLSAGDLIALVLERCRLQEISLGEFENKVGWELSPFVAQPQRLFEEITLEGMRWLCGELEIDWHRTLKQP